MLLNKRISIFDFLKTIKFDLIFIGSYSILVGYMDQYGFLSKISIPIAITGVFGTAVALLLGFRTNQAYERWWEARIIWGGLLSMIPEHWSGSVCLFLQGIKEAIKRW